MPSRLETLLEIAGNLRSFFKKTESAERARVEPTFDGSAEDGSSRPAESGTSASVSPAVKKLANDILVAPDTPSAVRQPNSAKQLLDDDSGSVTGLTKAQRKKEAAIRREVDNYIEGQKGIGRDEADVLKDAGKLERSLRQSRESTGISGKQLAIGGGVVAFLAQQAVGHGLSVGGLMYDLNPYNWGKMITAAGMRLAGQRYESTPTGLTPAQEAAHAAVEAAREAHAASSHGGTAPSTAPAPIAVPPQPIDPATGCDPLFGCAPHSSPPPTPEQHSQLLDGKMRVAGAGGHVPVPPMRTILTGNGTPTEKPETVAYAQPQSTRKADSPSMST